MEGEDGLALLEEEDGWAGGGELAEEPTEVGDSFFVTASEDAGSQGWFLVILEGRANCGTGLAGCATADGVDDHEDGFGLESFVHRGGGTSFLDAMFGKVLTHRRQEMFRISHNLSFSMILPDVGSHYTLKQSPYSSHMILMRLLDPVRLGRRLLDVGCGNGFLARLLGQTGFQVTGLEHPQGYDANFPAEVALIAHDLETPLPELPGKFDVIVVADVLEHLRKPSDLLTALRPYLSKGGCVVASLPNSGNIYFRLNILLGRFPQEDKGLFDRTHLHFYMWQNWEDLFSACGFELEVYDVSGIPVGLAFASMADSWLVKMGEWGCYQLARIWKTLFAYQFLVVAKPKL